MTIQEAIDQVDRHLVNTYDKKDKIRWLSQLDRRVKEEIIDTHTGGEAVAFNGYDENTAGGTVLLIPDAFCEIYQRYLEAQIHYANQEEDRCNNASDAFETKWAAFRNWYNRQHMPLGQKLSV
ncbi:MAG: hypothetical protein IKA47_12465 [Oscillospiraceae bacterium]|nr:hypothetical protein [Oscillospiraceae bacterium]